MGAVFLQRADDLHGARLALDLLRLAFHRLDAFADVGDDQVQLRIGLRLQLAVGDDAAHFAIHLLRQLAILCRGQLAFVNVVQRGLHVLADVLHALAQRRVGGPLLALVQRQFGRSGAMLVRMGVLFSGRKAGCGNAERQSGGSGQFPDAIASRHKSSKKVQWPGWAIAVS